MLQRSVLRFSTNKLSLNVVKNFKDPKVSADGSYLTVTSLNAEGSKPVKASLPAAWFLDNCNSHRHATGQRATNLFNERSNDNYKKFLKLPKLASAKLVIPEGTSPDAITSPIQKHLEVTFKDNSKATVPLATIQAFVFDKNQEHMSVTHHPLTRADQIHRVDYKNFIAHLQLDVPTPLRDNAFFKKGTPQHYAALKHLAVDGIIVVTGCGTSEEPSLNLATACGSFPMPTLYGTDWHVASAPQEGSKNIAYTSVRLDLHQDLAYHESMPGLQFLHCQKFSSNVTGGNTFFVDSFSVVEEFRRKHPKDFDVFTKVPVAFMKDDFDRPLPAQYYYATPHIHLNDRGEINKVFWAPSFEAPVPVEGKKCKDYYKARAVFCDLLHDMSKTSTLSLRLAEGECVVWQQVRLWHGRDAFTEREPQSRILHGAYANLDQFRNNVVAKGIIHGDPTRLSTYNFMNRSFR